MVLFVVVCGTPGLGLYWFRQHYRVFSNISQSMEPTIRRREKILVDMHYFRNHKPARRDVVVIERPDVLVIKRVIGLPGDMIEGHDGTVLVNGTAIAEPYAQLCTSESLEAARNFGPAQLRPGDYFVLGDNRDNSLDSRFPQFGPIPVTKIVGRPLFILASENGDRAWERIK